MVRGFLIVLITLVVLIATVVGVVGAGLRRIAAQQQQADANWHRPDPVATAVPTTSPATQPASAANADDPQSQTFDSIELLAQDAQLHGQVQIMDSKSTKTHTEPKDAAALAKWQMRQRMGGQTITKFLTDFRTSDDYADWSVNLPRAADYEIDLTYACAQYQQGGQFVVKAGDKELSFTAEGTRSEGNFRVFRVGKLTLPAGNTTFSLRANPTSIRSHCLINLRGAQLIPLPVTATP